MKKIPLIVILTLLLSSCQESTPPLSPEQITLDSIQRQQAIRDSIQAVLLHDILYDSFDEFLENFKEDPNISQWGEDAIAALLDKEKKKPYSDFPIPKVFICVPKPQYIYLNFDIAAHLDEKNRIPNPSKKFVAYAHKKTKQKYGWLVSIYFHKYPFHNREMNAHPYVLATLDADGNKIDEIVWWHIWDGGGYQTWREGTVNNNEFIECKFDNKTNEIITTFKRFKVLDNGKFEVTYTIPTPADDSWF